MQVPKHHSERRKQLNTMDNFCLLTILYHIKDKNIDITMKPENTEDLKFHGPL